MEKTLKYEFSQAEVQFILNGLNKVQISGVQTAQSLVSVTTKLQTPANADELDKDAYNELKNKFEPKKEDKKDK